MKLILVSLTHCVIFRSLSSPRLSKASKTMRVTTIDVNMLAMMPALRVMAKPLTGPDPCQNRIMAVSSVVMLASKMVEKALS